MYSVKDNDLMITGFSHSEISGLKLIYQLTEAYRRLSRPSSPSNAKASVVCTYSLDHITPKYLNVSPNLIRFLCYFSHSLVIWINQTPRSFKKCLEIEQNLKPHFQIKDYMMSYFTLKSQIISKYDRWILFYFIEGGLIPQWESIFFEIVVSMQYTILR